MLTKAEIIERLKAHHPAARQEEGEWAVASSVIKGAKIDREERLIKGTIATTAVDMDREVVDPAGMDFSFFPERVKSVYYNHDYKSMPVGACRNIAKRDGGASLYATTYIVPGTRGDDLLTAIECEAVSGFSIGAKARDFGRPTQEEVQKFGTCDQVVRKSLLIEYSIVPMPCNQEALISLVSKSLIHRSSAVEFGLEDTPERKFHAVTTPAARKAVWLPSGGIVLTRKLA